MSRCCFVLGRLNHFTNHSCNRHLIVRRTADPVAPAKVALQPNCCDAISHVGNCFRRLVISGYFAVHTFDVDAVTHGYGECQDASLPPFQKFRFACARKPGHAPIEIAAIQ